MKGAACVCMAMCCDRCCRGGAWSRIGTTRHVWRHTLTQKAAAGHHHSNDVRRAITMSKTAYMRGLQVRTVNSRAPLIACVDRLRRRKELPERVAPLQVFISDIRACQNKEQEQRRVEKELAKIRAKFGEDKALSGAQHGPRGTQALACSGRRGGDAAVGSQGPASREVFRCRLKLPSFQAALHAMYANFRPLCFPTMKDMIAASTSGSSCTSTCWALT
jgi:hypothetical protein